MPAVRLGELNAGDRWPWRAGPPAASARCGGCGASLGGMNFTDEVVLVNSAVRDTAVLTTAGGEIGGSAGTTNLYVDNQLNQPVTLHLDLTRDRGVTWRELDAASAITVAAGVTDLLTANKALQASYGQVRVRVSCAAAPSSGTLIVALHVNRRT